MSMTENTYGDALASQHVTAFFDTREDAEAAQRRIEAEGIASSDIRMVEGNDGTTETKEKGFFEALGDFFMPDEDRYSYAEGLNRGGYLLSVTTTGGNRDRILDILDDEGTIDMDEREESWRAEGWTGGSATTGMTDSSGMTDPSGMTGTSGMMDRTGMADATGLADGPGMSEASGMAGTSGMAADRVGARDAGRSGMVDGTIEVVEESLRVGKREVDHGRVRVRSYMVETPVEEQVTLHDEEVHVNRRPVDRAVASGDAAFTDRTLEATERREEAVVSKEARVTEEITLDTDAKDRTETVRDSVRHTEVEIEDERTGKSTGYADDAENNPARKI